MKILIFGGSGQLGRSLLETSLGLNNEVIAPSRNEIDIEDFGKVTNYIAEEEPAIVINATAWTNVPGAEDDPEGAKRLNCDAVSNLAGACKATNSVLIHVSTDYVFDGTQQEPYLENATTNSLNQYGKSKLAGEIALIESGIANYYIIRTSWLYSKYGKNFVKTIVTKSLKSESASIIDDQFGSPTFAGDLAEGIKSIIEVKPEPGIYHYSNEGITNWYEFGRLIYEKTLNNSDLVSARKTGQDELKRPSYSPLSLEKWKSSGLVDPIDWNVSLERELSEIIKAVKEEVK